MAHNGPYSGPPWSGGSSDEPHREAGRFPESDGPDESHGYEPSDGGWEHVRADPYREPSDPWGEHGVAAPAWVADRPPIPHQPPSYGGGPVSVPGWDRPASKRSGPIVALVLVLGLLIAGGLGVAVWLVQQRHDRPAAQQHSPAASSTPTVTATASGTEDARFVSEGQCVVNQGTNDLPQMRRTVCIAGTYQVLKVIKGKTTGEKDAEAKCARVPGYTNWYFYDSEFDDLDLVLCLKRR